jgi:galactitol-specific phosphotransferase system IIB component
MLNNNFYWGTVRKAVVAFGNIFNNISLIRKDAAGNTIQTIRVPLAYAPKQKFIAKIQQRPDVDTQPYQVILPRMAFEMRSMKYDPTRKIAPLQKIRKTDDINSSLSQYVPVPYNLDMTLYVYARNQDDGLQIIEQILPYFNPDYNLTIKAIPELDLLNDLMIVLDEIQFEDNYEGDLSDRRAIIWTLDFTMKLNFYGPINTSSVIRKTISNIFSDSSLQQKTETIHVDALTAAEKEAFIIQNSNTAFRGQVITPANVAVAGSVGDYSIMEYFEDF